MTDLTIRLPSELLLRIFGEVTDTAPHNLHTRGRQLLVGPGHTCARWRALARAHPDFSKHIVYDAYVANPLELFLAQLEVGHDGNKDICLDLVALWDPHVICVLMSHVARHIPRCTSLSLKHVANASNFEAIVRAFCQSSAPRLRSFSFGVHFNHKTTGISTLDLESIGFPSRIFQGNAPLLKRLSITRAISELLPAGQAIPAFASVQWLQLTCSAQRPGPANRVPPLSILYVTPALRRLEMDTNLDDAPPVQSDIALMASLALDYLSLGPIGVEWAHTLALLDLEKIPEINVWSEHPAMFESITGRYADSLRGPLELVVTRFETTIRAPRTGRTLTIQGKPESAGRLLERISGSQAGKVVQLEVGTNHWELVQSVAPVFPAAEKLILRVVDDLFYRNSTVERRQRAATAQSEFPALRELELRDNGIGGRDTWGLDADTVAKSIIVVSRRLSVLTVQHPLLPETVRSCSLSSTRFLPSEQGTSSLALRALDTG